MLHLEQIPTLHQDFVKNLRRALSRPETFNMIRSTMELIFENNFPTGIYLLKVNNIKIRTRCEICSKLTIKTPQRPN